MTEHTAGPWAYRPELHDDWGVVRAGRYWICQAKDPNVYTDEQLAEHRATRTDPWEANARLIAAAPDLLAALEQVARSIRSAGEEADYSMVFAAIAKARGEEISRGEPGAYPTPMTTQQATTKQGEV